MRHLRLTDLPDEALVRGLSALVARDRATTAALLAHIGEVDARRLYLPAGYSSMHAYCVEALHFSDDAAYKRIQAARAARQFPALLRAIARGRLHLSAVCLLAPHLTRANFGELVAAATHRRKAEIERLLFDRFAAAELIAATRAAAPGELAPGQVAPGTSTALAPGQVPAAGPPPAMTRPLRLDLTPATRDKLRRAQELLGYAVPSGDPAEVIDRALDALIAQLEGRKSAATVRPRRPRVARAPRTVPARVRRAVWMRDGGRCAFVAPDGHRCTTRARLEFDHVDPVARGGRPEVDRMRLLCRAHNQYEAERLFGAKFMAARRAQASERPRPDRSGPPPS